MNIKKIVNIKTFLKVIIFIIAILLVIVLPFLIENIILCESVAPFNAEISFSKETWFGFIGSYVGAIGTIVLGYIAFYQNKKYKELSDESEERYLALQEEIKELTKKSVCLIDLNSRIEEAKYYPILSDIYHSFENIKGDNIGEFFDMDNDSFQITIRDGKIEEWFSTYNDLFNEYYTFVYTLKNDSEKTIRNFNCTDVETNGKKDELGFWKYYSCDVRPGTLVRCVYATKFDLTQKMCDGDIGTLSFRYSMENVIGERFYMTIDFYMGSNEAGQPNFYAEVSPVNREKDS